MLGNHGKGHFPQRLCRLYSLIAVGCLLLTMYLPGIAHAEPTPTEALKATDWAINRGTSVSDTEKGVQIDVGTEDGWLASTTYNIPFDMSGEISFSFTIDEWEPYGGLFCFSFSREPESYNCTNVYQSGVYVGGYLWSGAINAFDGGWKVMNKGDVNTVTIKRGENGWETYLANSGNPADDNVQFMETVGFDKIPKSFYSKNKGYLNVYFMHSADDVTYYPAKLTVHSVSGLYGTGSSVPGEIYTQDKDVSPENWHANRNVTITGDTVPTFDMEGAFATNFGYQQPIAVTNEMSFDLTIDSWPVKAGFGSWLSIQLNKKPEKTDDAHPYFQAGGGNENGIGAFMYRAGREGVFQTSLGDWLEWPSGEKTVITLKKEATGWVFYYCNSKSENKLQSFYKIPFSSFPEDGFKTGKAYLSIYIYDCNETNITFNNAKMTVSRINETIDPNSVPGEEEETLEYDPEQFTIPYWQGSTVYNESALPITNQDGTVDDISLLYDISEILSVKSSDLQKTYVQGTDYTLKDGKLHIVPTGSIPLKAYNEYYLSSGGMDTQSGGHIWYGEGRDLVSKQLAVTYTHEDNWEDSIPSSKGYLLPKTMNKLKNKQNLKVLLYGDSIAAGGNCTMNLGMMPFCPCFGQIFVDKLKLQYGYDDISFTNTSVGGKNVEWGLENVNGSVIDYAPDLVMIHFGTNNALNPDMFASKTQQLIDAIKKALPNTEIIVISNILPNEESTMYGPEYYADLSEYEYSLMKCEKAGVAVTRTTSAHQYIKSKKRFCDITANNINHPNDFVHRLIAMTLLATVSEGGSEADDSLKNNTYVLPDKPDYYSISDTVTRSGKSFIMNTGSLQYIGSRLYNDMALFRLKVTSMAADEWLAVTLRSPLKKADIAYNQNCYAFLIRGNGSVELMHFGADNGVLASASYSGLLNGTVKTVRAGTISVDNGVRIILEIGGKILIDYTDSSSSYIKNTGYTGLSLLGKASCIVTVGTIHTDTDDDSPDFVLEPGDAFSYVGHGFDHATENLVDNKRIIYDARLAGLPKEVIEPIAEDADKDKLLPVFDTVHEINLGAPDATFTFDITDTPLIDTEIWQVMMEESNKNKTIIFVSYDENDDIAYRITFKCSDIKKAARTNISLITGVAASGDGSIFTGNYQAYGIKTAATELPGKAAVACHPSTDWLNGKDNNNLYAYYFNNALNEVGSGIAIDDDGLASFTADKAGQYYLSDAALSLKPAASTGTDNSAGEGQTNSDKLSEIIKTGIQCVAGLALLAAVISAAVMAVCVIRKKKSASVSK